MIITNMVWTKENIWEFVKYYTFFKSKMQRNLLISFLACILFLFILCLTIFIFIHEIVILLISFGILAVMGGYILFFYLLMKSMAKKLLIANSENNGLEICINEDVIFIRKNDEPHCIIPWSEIAEINTGKNAVYITSKENALLLIEYSQINTGSKDDLIKLAEKKNGEITK